MAPAIDAQDQGRPVKGTEHDRDPPVCREMGLRFIARSADIEIGDATRPQDAETVHALGAEVDPRAVRRGRHEEDRLLRDKGNMVVCQFRCEIGHVRSF